MGSIERPLRSVKYRLLDFGQRMRDIGRAHYDIRRSTVPVGLLFEDSAGPGLPPNPRASTCAAAGIEKFLRRIGEMAPDETCAPAEGLTSAIEFLLGQRS